MTKHDYEFVNAGPNIAEQTAEHIAQSLRRAISERGSASLMVSGGSSPAKMYEALSLKKLPWEHVTLGLVDERWVGLKHGGSNEAFIRRTLHQNEAQLSNLIGLKTPHETASSALADIHKTLSLIPIPFDVCVMGMGSDAHTASWFPNSKGLKRALNPEKTELVAAINAEGCPVAGDITERITLTRHAVISSRNIILFIPGEEKQAVFEAALKQSIYHAPVKTLLGAGSRLRVVTGTK